MMKWASSLSSLLWTLLYMCWAIGFPILQTMSHILFIPTTFLFWKKKIAKTHKRFTTSVPSPVSVSPNKYASLVVEDIDTQYATDCADAPTPFVSLGSATIPSTVSNTKHVWYSEHGTYHWFEIILEWVMSATHVAVIPCTRIHSDEEEFLKKWLSWGEQWLPDI